MPSDRPKLFRASSNAQHMCIGGTAHVRERREVVDIGQFVLPELEPVAEPTRHECSAQHVRQRSR